MNREQTNSDENSLILVSQNAAIYRTTNLLLGDGNCIELRDLANASNRPIISYLNITNSAQHSSNVSILNTVRNISL